MNKINLLAIILIGVMQFGCSDSDTGSIEQANHDEVLNGEAEILQSWHGDFPVSQLQLLPEDQTDQAVGYINDLTAFAAIWTAFMPDETVPEIDFKSNLVLFARNTQFYNRIRIGKVNVTDGVAEVLAMETLSARPIEENCAMSLVVVSRQGIKAIHTVEGQIAIPDSPEDQ